jgi:hypothetical protein
MKKILAILILLASFGMAQEGSIPSKKELFLRARDALKTSLESGDTARAGQAIDYLKSNVEEGAPLTLFEEYLAEMEAGRFSEGIELYADMRRTILDSTFKPEWKRRISAEDPLTKYLYRNLSPFDSTKADSLHARVVPAEIGDEYKDLYRTLLFSELIINRVEGTYYGTRFSWISLYDTTNAEEFLKCARNFVEKYPQSAYTRIFKEQTIPFVEKHMQPLRDFRKDPLKHKYYTGGLGVFAGMWAGFFAGDFTDHFDTEMGSSLILEASLQFRRISLNAYANYGFINMPKDYEYRWGKYEDESLGLTLGFTAYDSRWLKAEPFVGVGVYDFSCTEGADESTVFLLGANADVRLLASKPNRIGGMSFALVARFKYMMQFGSFYEYLSPSVNYNKEKGWVDESLEIESGFANFQFALSLGLYLW